MERMENKVPHTTLTLSFLQQKAQASSRFLYEYNDRGK